MIKRHPYGKDYLDWYYNKGGMSESILGLDSVGGATPMGGKFAKAVGPWDAPASPYAKYFTPKYSAAVAAWTARATEVEKLLRKTTFVAEGDSLKYYVADLAGLAGYIGSGTPFATATAEAAPTVTVIDEIAPAWLIDPWITSYPSRIKSTWQNSPVMDPAFIRDYHAENLPNQIDKMLTVTVDTPVNDATHFDMESIDHIVSNAAEATTTYCSAATDPDIYWGAASIVNDRSAATTFDAQVDLPSTGVARKLQLEMIDDVVAEAMAYSKRRNYIGITGPKTLNEMQKLIDPKQRYLSSPMDYEFTLNGVSTRKGYKTGFTVGAYISNGIEIPMFSCRHVANETSANRSATVTDADIGNIYILDMDEIEIRVAAPVTYMETPPEAMLTTDTLTTRHWFLYGAQLFATKFASHAGVKYLKST